MRPAGGSQISSILGLESPRKEHRVVAALGVVGPVLVGVIPVPREL